MSFKNENKINCFHASTLQAVKRMLLELFRFARHIHFSTLYSQPFSCS
jgi:hypothetical protein